MSLRKFLVSRVFLFNLALALVLVVGLVFITLRALNNYTRHGVSYPVPNLTGLNVSEAKTSAAANNLTIEIIDSVFNKKFEPGTIVDQQPVANSKVKANRTILLTVNSLELEKVTLPRLTDISFRQAQVLIENSGLFIGEISYQPSEYNDLVLDILQDSIPVKTGDRILKGSSIDLIVGRNKGNLKTQLPNLIGFSLDDAMETLTASKLNEGVLIYDNTFNTAEDSINARIYKQQPNPKYSSTIDMGSSIDIWLTTDSLKINEAYSK